MAAGDVVVQPPVYVPVDIGLTVCVAASYFRGTVKAALIQAFSTRDRPRLLPPGHLSAVVAAAMAVAGVAWVEVVTFYRSGQPPTGVLAGGLIVMDRLEVARCDSEAADPAAGFLWPGISDGRVAPGCNPHRASDGPPG